MITSITECPILIKILWYNLRLTLKKNKGTLVLNSIDNDRQIHIYNCRPLQFLTRQDNVLKGLLYDGTDLKLFD